MRRSVLSAACAAIVLGISSLGALAQEVSERVLGDPNAPVEIIEYSSLTCPHCASFHTDTLPTIKENYIDTGKARLVMRDFPLNEPAVKAAVVAHCAGDERYFRFLDALFKNQATWAQASDIDAALVQFAKVGGLSEEATRACLADEAMEAAVLESRLEGASEYGVNSTPTFVVNGEVVRGTMGPEEFVELIEDQL